MPKIPIETFWFNIHSTMCRSNADPIIIIIICVVCWCRWQSVKRHLFFYTQVCFIYLLDTVNNVRSDTWYYNLTYAREHIDNTKSIKYKNNDRPTNRPATQPRENDTTTNKKTPRKKEPKYEFDISRRTHFRWFYMKKKCTLRAQQLIHSFRFQSVKINLFHFILHHLLWIWYRDEFCVAHAHRPH